MFYRPTFTSHIVFNIFIVSYLLFHSLLLMLLQKLVTLSIQLTISIFSRSICYIVIQEKLDILSSEHNFSKYCPILIILSLLQTKNYLPINPLIEFCDFTYSLLLHHLEQEAQLSQRDRTTLCVTLTEYFAKSLKVI